MRWIHLWPTERLCLWLTHWQQPRSLMRAPVPTGHQHDARIFFRPVEGTMSRHTILGPRMPNFDFIKQRYHVPKTEDDSWTLLPSGALRVGCSKNMTYRTYGGICIIVRMYGNRL